MQKNCKTNLGRTSTLISDNKPKNIKKQMFSQQYLENNVCYFLT